MAASSASENVISESRQSSPVVTDLGLTRIDRIPKDASVKVVADIVFVHGLQGHPRTTWETKTHTKAHKSLRERMRNVIPGRTKQDHAKQDYEVQGDTKVFWPADLLPDDHKDIRILTYGYDSKVTKGFIAPSSKNNIFQHGESLLNAICRSRTGCSDRPIIFVAHSLGGLLVKQALIEAQKQKRTPSSQALYAHTYAIIFFGTPHRGSDMASWGLVLSNIAKAVQIDANKAILRDLDPSSGSSKLQELRKDFDDILHDRNHGNGTNMLRIYTFQEEQGMTGVSGLRSKVVPDWSSSFDSRDYGNDFIHANHMNICRFVDRKGDGYLKFNGVLEAYIHEVNEKQQKLQNYRQSESSRKLEYSSMNARAYQLYNPDVTDETLAWIWSVTSFVNWLSGGDGVFWISGKPASGKSTLIQHIKSHDRILSLLGRSNDMEWRILYFFFDFRGAKSITNNSEGLLRSLLFQLIESVPHLDTSGIEKLERGHASSWHESELRDALRVTLRSVSGGICIFIDGLDEYEGNLRHLIEFLTGLSASDRVARKSIKICISSRPEPIPSLLLRDLPSLSMSAHNTGGITSYCRQILKDLDIELSYFSESIAKRAEGVFLWARFAIEELIQGVSEGEDHLELLNRLDSFPQDLEDVYDRMLSRLDISATKECMIMLQLVCFEKRFESLTCWELHAATRFAVDKTLILPESVKCETGQIPHERIVAKSCGFLELIEVRYFQTRLYKSEEIHIVKLIHKSVETYLSKKGWNALQGRIQENQVSHELLLLQLCVQYIKSVLDHMGLQDITDLQVWNTEFKEIKFGRKIRTSMLLYPFLQYAANSLFNHARALERQHSVSSYEYLYGSLTEQVIFTHYFVSTTPFPSKLCGACVKLDRMTLHSSSLQTLAAFLHGLALYCKDALATNPTLEEVFADRALLCAIRSSNLDNDDDNFATTVTSLALKIVNVVKQHHLELALDTIWNTDGALLILQHESVKTLRLFDQKGREVKMPWMFAHAPRFEEEDDQEALRNVMEGIMNAARDRGEDLREQCGPEGNLVETLLQQIENLDTSRPFWGSRVRAVKIKLRLICTYYQARSWPLEYDLSILDSESTESSELSSLSEESWGSDDQVFADEPSFESDPILSE